MTRTTRPGSRQGAALVAGALALGVFLSTVPARAQTGAPGAVRSIDSACPPEDVPDSGFDDVPSANVHAAAIECIDWYAITSGTSEGTYGPGQNVPRDQMASFLARLIDHVDAGALGTTPAEDQFPCPSDPTELPRASAHHDAVQRLAAAGVVTGGPGGRPADCYGPGLEVTRGQMASFLHRLLGLLGHGSSASGEVFGDDDGTPHEASINAIARQGIAGGYPDATFRPNLSVRRDQMASFLARTLDLLVEAGATDPPPVARIT